MKNLVKTIISLSLVSMLVLAFTACGKYDGTYNAVLIYQDCALSSVISDIKVEFNNENKVYVEDTYAGYLEDSTISSSDWGKAATFFASVVPSKISIEKIMACTTCQKVVLDDKDSVKARVAFLKINSTIIMLCYSSAEDTATIFRVYELERV